VRNTRRVRLLAILAVAVVGVVVLVVGLTRSDVDGTGGNNADDGVGNPAIDGIVTTADGYVTLYPGTAPVIFTAGHGGSARPDSVADRTLARCIREPILGTDLDTIEMALDIRDEWFRQTGEYPWVIITTMARSKVDVNLPIGPGACGDEKAERVWQGYHDLITRASDAITSSGHDAFLTDIHGHQERDRIELGYLLTADTLRQSDSELDADPIAALQSSVRTLADAAPMPLSAFLRGPTSLGTLLDEAGYPTVPSAAISAPDADGPDSGYFTGGFTTRTHGCRDGGSVCAVQLELNRTGIRDTADNRRAFASALVTAYRTFFTAVAG
jgi:hypothetical protein